MSLYKEVVDKIKLNKKLKASGEFLGIPYPFDKLNEYLCSIDKGSAIGVLGATGAGKSRFVRYLFIYHCYKFYRETGYKIRILYFCMEDSKEKVYNNIIVNYLKDNHNILITTKELQSKGRELPDFVLEKLEEAHAYFNEFEKVVTLIDGETEPTKIYNICKSMALRLGEVTKYTEIIEGEPVPQYKYNSDTHVIAIFDNQSNLDTEDGTSNEQAAILKFIKEYVRLKLCNFFNWTCIVVLQKDFDSEKPQVNKGGELIVSKLEGGLGDIGDSKRASRALHLVFNLFAPSRYDLLRFPIPPKDRPELAYNLEILGNRFRSIRVIKSNDTDTGMRVPLLFSAIDENFKELPPPDSVEMKELYNKFSNKGVFTKTKNIVMFDDSEAPF